VPDETHIMDYEVTKIVKLITWKWRGHIWG